MTTRRETECPTPHWTGLHGALARAAMFRHGTLPALDRGRRPRSDGAGETVERRWDGPRSRLDQRIGEAEPFTSPSKNAYVLADLRREA